MATKKQKVCSGGLCMTQYEYLQNCLAKDGGQNLIQKFLMGRGKKKNPCEMTEAVSILDFKF